MNGRQVFTKTDTAAEKVLERLERWEKRLEGHYAPKRRCSRRQFHRKVTVFVPPSVLDAANVGQAERVEVWARNVSQGGMSFISDRTITAPQIVVRLKFSEDSYADYRAAVARRKQVDEDFWEYGVSFRERLNQANAS